jgi:hypothetical protein
MFDMLGLSAQDLRDLQAEMKKERGSAVEQLAAVAVFLLRRKLPDEILRAEAAEQQKRRQQKVA